MTKRFLLILLTALCARTACAFDEAAVDSLSSDFRLDEVEVTARLLSKDIIIPQTLRGAELQRLSVLNVADALRYFSGVQLKDYGGVGGIKTINIRSMGSQHTAVFYNGIQLGNAQNGQVDLGRFSLDNIESVELYNGQKSDIFQSAREFGSAGNIYLTTRRPYFREGEQVHVRAQMRAGSFALANPSIGLDIRLTDALSLTLDGEYVYSDGRYPFRYRRVLPDGQVAYDTTAVRQNGDINAVRAELGLHHYYRTTGFWRLHVYNYWSNRGIPGAIVNNVWRNGERLTDRNTFVQAQWQDEWFGRWSTRLLMKYANDFTHYRNYDERLLPSNNRYTQQEVYLSLANKVQLLDWWDASVAYDYQFNTLARENLLLEQPADHFSRHSHWLSAATALNVREYLRLQASVLLTQITNNQSPITNNQSPITNSPKVTPGVFLSFRPYPKIDLSLNAFYKQSYRYPTFNDLYYTDLGNASLRPELARQHSVELAYKITNLTVSPSNGETLDGRGTNDLPITNAHLVTLGTPIAFLIRNRDARPEDYEWLKSSFRVGHADRTYQQKYGIRDWRGGGRASARETAARVVAGCIARQSLAARGITIRAELVQVGTETDPAKFIETITRYQHEGDSIGGIITCTVSGLPVGTGEPIFHKLQAELAFAIMSINACKGFEYGTGFGGVTQPGSAINAISGGIAGGISDGTDLFFRCVFKPTPSTKKAMESIANHLTVFPSNGETLDGRGTNNQSLIGRHDACVAVRAVPVVEAMTALCLADLLAVR